MNKVYQFIETSCLLYYGDEDWGYSYPGDMVVSNRDCWIDRDNKKDIEHAITFNDLTIKSIYEIKFIHSCR